MGGRASSVAEVRELTRAMCQRVVAAPIPGLKLPESPGGVGRAGWRLGEVDGVAVWAASDNLALYWRWLTGTGTGGTKQRREPNVGSHVMGAVLLLSSATVQPLL